MQLRSTKKLAVFTRKKSSKKQKFTLKPRHPIRGRDLPKLKIEEKSESKTLRTEFKTPPYPKGPELISSPEPAKKPTTNKSNYDIAILSQYKKINELIASTHEATETLQQLKEIFKTEDNKYLLNIFAVDTLSIKTPNVPELKHLTYHQKNLLHEGMYPLMIAAMHCRAPAIIHFLLEQDAFDLQTKIHYKKHPLNGKNIVEIAHMFENDIFLKELAAYSKRREPRIQRMSSTASALQQLSLASPKESKDIVMKNSGENSENHKKRKAPDTAPQHSYPLRSKIADEPPRSPSIRR